MELYDIFFYAFAAAIIISAAIVVLSKNIMYSAFALLFTLFGVSGIFVLLSADFLAVTQIMIYIGGILVLIIFGVMLTSRITGVDIKSGTTGKIQVAIGGLIALCAAIGLILIYCGPGWHTTSSMEPVRSTIIPIGNELLTNYLLAFEAASILLLIAIVGAAKIARRK